MSPIMRALSMLCFVVLAAAACEELNKPAAVPKSEPRTACFSDVECPGSKCVKASGNDIQGQCAAAAPPDAGADAAPEGEPPPSVKPQPGDIQI